MQPTAAAAAAFIRMHSAESRDWMFRSLKFCMMILFDYLSWGVFSTLTSMRSMWIRELLLALVRNLELHYFVAWSHVVTKACMWLHVKYWHGCGMWKQGPLMLNFCCSFCLNPQREVQLPIYSLLLRQWYWEVKSKKVNWLRVAF